MDITRKTETTGWVVYHARFEEYLCVTQQAWLEDSHTKGTFYYYEDIRDVVPNIPNSDLRDCYAVPARILITQRTLDGTKLNITTSSLISVEHDKALPLR